MEPLSVPLIKQNPLECGPAALAMVLRYFNKNITPEVIANTTGIIKNFGVKTIALAEFAKEEGFETICYSYNKRISKGLAKIRKPSTKDIIRFLKQKLPVIISVGLFLLYDEKPSEMGHFIVITCYQKGVFL